MNSYKPAYIFSYQSGDLEKKIGQAREILNSCRLCPRDCRVNRLEGEAGFCRTGERARVAAWHAHFGEEEPLVGKKGSGTVFFSYCNLGCVFCQNEDISHRGEGREVDEVQLAEMMLSLQQQGCHNINLVTPSHVVPQILAALPLAIEKGLHLPLVYNSGGYDEPDSIRLLEGVVDIYMPDFKFWNRETASRFCRAPDYPEKARTAIREMHRQVGDLEISEQGIARKGLLVRHLVMPEALDETAGIMKFLVDLSPNTYVNVMEQYHPCYLARNYSPINRALTRREYEKALDSARRAGLSRLAESPLARILARLGL
ncbi:MAG: radical SAM protein [Thermodesulfobacteriota bacterium]